MFVLLISVVVLSLEQGLPQEEPDIEQIIQKNAAASYLHNYYSTDSAQSDIAKIAVQNKAKKTNAASYLHNYEGIGSRQKEVNKKTPQNKGKELEKIVKIYKFIMQYT